MTSSPPRFFHDPWMYGPMAAAALLYLVVDWTNSNTSFFLTLNQLSRWTGDAVWAHATVLGDTLVALTLLFAFAGRKPEVLWAGLLAALLSATLTHGLKTLFEMPRPPAVLPPELFHLIGPELKKNSFPSGHTATIFTLAAVLCLQITNTGWRTLLLLIAVAVGLSRAVVGVHWPLDILTGAFSGWMAGVAGSALAQRYPAGLTSRVQIVIGVILAGCAVAVLARPNPIYEQTRIFQIVLAAACLFVGARGLWKKYKRS